MGKRTIALIGLHNLGVRIIFNGTPRLIDRGVAAALRLRKPVRQHGSSPNKKTEIYQMFGEGRSKESKSRVQRQGSRSRSKGSEIEARPVKLGTQADV